MAEAAVDSMEVKYFCHECSIPIDISPNLAILTCPKCNSDFIEELTQELEESSVPTNGLYPQDYIASLFSALSMTPPPQPPSAYDSTDDEAEEHQMINYRRTRRDTPTLDHRLPRFLETIFTSFGNSEANWLSNILNANLDDYVWGENGLDNIVTQLLNQMEGPSPPPASKIDIANLQKVSVDQEFLDNASQCSICMESYVLEDTLNQLPCFHWFHVDCILPWLELHGTCPICRQTLNSESSSKVEEIPTEQDFITVNLREQSHDSFNGLGAEATIDVVSDNLNKSNDYYNKSQSSSSNQLNLEPSEQYNFLEVTNSHENLSNSDFEPILNLQRNDEDKDVNIIDLEEENDYYYTQI